MNCRYLVALLSLVALVVLTPVGAAAQSAAVSSLR